MSRINKFCVAAESENIRDTLPTRAATTTALAISVTRLGNFRPFLVAIFLTKVAQILSDFIGRLF